MAITVTGAACLVFLVLGLLVYRAVTTTTFAQFDEMLQQQATLALRYADHEYTEGDAAVPVPSGSNGRAMPFDMVYQITTQSNRLLYRSPSAPTSALAPGGSGKYSNVELDGQSWRVYSLSSHRTPLVVHVAQPLEYRNALLSGTLRAVALPLIFALVLLTLLIGVVTERAFRPVRRMAAELTGRGADDLSAVDTAAMPVETHALGVALNGLLSRHAEVLARERRFTADAAHELRTPLAALRAQAQVASRARKRSEAQRALGKLQMNIDRTTHLVSQLLALARLEPGSPATDAPRTTIRAMLDLVVEDLSQMAAEKEVTLEVHGCEGTMPGSPEMLYLMIRNLLENAIRHVGPHSHVWLAVTRDEHTVVLRISDDGPGIPTAERARVFERFYRISGRSAEGSGLGLSIVGRVVELLSGQIELSAPPAGSGLIVTVRLPLERQCAERRAAS